MDIVVKQITKDFLFQNLNQFIEILKDIPNEYWREEHFLAELPGKFQLSCCAVVDEKVIGYIISTAKGSLAVHINKFMVSTESRGKEIGSKLFNYYENIVRSSGMNSITLKVYKDNVAAIRFYTRNGFCYDSESVDNNSQVLVKMRKVL